MRFLLLCLGFFLLVPGVAIPQAGGRGRPPGIATADTMANAPLEAPSKSSARQVNIDQVNAETQELRRLADGLPALRANCPRISRRISRKSRSSQSTFAER